MSRTFLNTLFQQFEPEKTRRGNFNFWPKVWTIPFVKIKILQLLISTFYWSKKLFFYQGHCQTLYLINMAEKSEGKETSNFWSKSSTNPFAKKANFSTSNYRLMWSLERVFVSRTSLNVIFEQFKPEERSWRNFKFLTKCMNYPLCKKWKFCTFLISMFYWSKKHFFYQGHCQTLFSINMAEKGEGKGASNVSPKSWTNPFVKNANFATF